MANLCTSAMLESSLPEFPQRHHKAAEERPVLRCRIEPAGKADIDRQLLARTVSERDEELGRARRAALACAGELDSAGPLLCQGHGQRGR